MMHLVHAAVPSIILFFLELVGNLVLTEFHCLGSDRGPDLPTSSGLAHGQ